MDFILKFFFWVAFISAGIWIKIKHILRALWRSCHSFGSELPAWLLPSECLENSSYQFLRCRSFTPDSFNSSAVVSVLDAERLQCMFHPVSLHAGVCTMLPESVTPTAERLVWGLSVLCGDWVNWFGFALLSLRQELVHHRSQISNLLAS